MLMIAEILLTAVGLIMLCTGKTLGSDPVRHPHVRLVGLLWLLMLPVAFILLIAAAAVYAVMNPQTASADLESGGPRWILGLAELVLVGAYYAAGHAWIKAIKRKVGSQQTQDDWSSTPQHWGPRLPQG